MNKMFQITSFNPLTSQILTRNFEGRISGISSFKQLNWNTSTGENFSHVPLYYILLLVLAGLMMLQGVGFLFSSIEKGLTTDAEHDRKAREREDEASIRDAETAAAVAVAAAVPDADPDKASPSETDTVGMTRKPNATDASQPALGSA